MEIVLPYRINQNITLKRKRIQTKITGIVGGVNSNGELVGYFSIETEHGKVSIDEIKTEPTKCIITINPKYVLGQEVLYHNNNPYKNYIIQRGVISGIEFSLSRFSKVYFYTVNNVSILDYDLYLNIDDFKRRVAPKRELKNGERYIFRNYLIQQKYLEPIKVNKVTTIHSEHRGEKFRNCFLYTSKEKFFNRMLAQVKCGDY